MLEPVGCGGRIRTFDILLSKQVALPGCDTPEQRSVTVCGESIGERCEVEVMRKPARHAPRDGSLQLIRSLAFKVTA